MTKPPTNSEWIAVDERLPEVEGRYLICFKDGNRIAIDTFDSSKSVITWWRRYYIAWMPLPSPYKPEGE